ncbi:transposase [Acidisoma cellulosilytica]|uniref:Transposase n=1 Tax=Acidisoma cellulosilyticum TaxID=2802395 RepID=A0A963Z8U4_9PROT|nr:transposase [Acidisoma cellulosilyticum]MCB8883973.1 transposase [Acidisoma cellulosilyticum]
MNDTAHKKKTITSTQRRRQWSLDEKIRMVNETYAPGASVSLIARQYRVNPNQIFTWRRLADAGTLSETNLGEAIVPALEHHALRKQIRELHGILGKKTLEVEALKKAFQLAENKKNSGSTERRSSLGEQIIILSQNDNHDLSLRQLAVLALCLQAELGQTVRAMASNLEIPRASVTRAVDRLEQAGYVQRLSDPFDGRSVVVIATRSATSFLADDS